jgi:hypothetical protein
MRAAAVVALGLCSQRPVGSQEVTAAQIDSIVRRAVAEKGIVGLSVGVMRDGRVILARATASGISTTNDTVTTHDVRHRLGDEAVHVLAAPDAGRRAPAVAERPVAKYDPRLTRAKDITLLDVGGHLSGYRDYYPLDFVDREDAEAAAGGRDHHRVRDASGSISSRARATRTATQGSSSSARVIEQVSGSRAPSSSANGS